MPSKVNTSSESDATSCELESKNSFAEISGDTEAKLSPQKKTWAEMSEDPNLMAVATSLSQLLNEECSSFGESMDLLARVINTVIVTKAKEIINQERDGLNASSQTEMVSRIHRLTTECKKFTTSMVDGVAAVNSVLDDLNKKKSDILSEMERFVRQMTAESDPVVVPVVAPARVVPEVSQRAKPATYAASVRAEPNASTTTHALVTTKIGLVDVTAPVANNTMNVPPMTIRFCPSINSFLINLDGEIYSFGAGTFVTRNSKTVAIYGKRCNSKEACDEATCTYYHDPLKFANGHLTRNMSIHYITEDLIKGVATDEDILANTFSRNPFLVEDLVQLAGMLLLKSLAVKRMVKNTKHQVVRRGDVRR
jgi:hypothetical protein